MNGKDLVRESFDKIYSSAEVISEEYSHGISIPLITLKEILDRAKLKKVDRKIRKFSKEYNKMIDVLYSSCEKVSSKLAGKVPLNILKQYIEVLKTSL